MSSNPFKFRTLQKLAHRRAQADRSDNDIADSSESPEAALHDSGSLQQKKNKPGPKRDSRPAPSAKLERNRQAQRSHRERKEQYTQTLEQEVMRLKDVARQTYRERDALVAEGNQLRQERDAAFLQRDGSLQQMLALSQEVEILRATLSEHGIVPPVEPTTSSPMGLPTSSPGHLSPPTDTLFTRSANSPSNYSVNSLSVNPSGASASDGRHRSLSQVPEHGFASTQTATTTLLGSSTLEEIALDFILTLERPCMQHIPFLVDRAYNDSIDPTGDEAFVSGHALMASAPPLSQIMSHPETRETNNVPDLKVSDIERLLNLSSAIQPNEVELPPVRAWKKIIDDPRATQLTADDFELIKNYLVDKVNCYKFGAVVMLEDVEQALNAVIDNKINQAQQGIFNL